MRKYDKSAVMKKAWEIKRTSKESFAEALKISWKIAKAALSESITLEFVSNEELTINMKTGVVSGKTYNSRNRIKKDFAGKWDGKNWTVDVNKVITNINEYAVLYATIYIVNATIKTVVKRWLVPDEKGEGYLAYTKWNDGTVTSCIFG